MRWTLLPLIMGCREATPAPPDTAAPTITQTEDTSASTHDSADPTPDTGDTADDTSEPTGLRCDDDWAATTLPAEFTTVQGTPYRVVQLDSEDLDEVYALVFYPPEDVASAYDEGAPVVVNALPSFDVRPIWATQPNNQIEPTWGAVEVQALYPGWTTQGYTTTGEADAGGLQSALALREAARFAAGRLRTTDGLSLAQVVQRPVCAERVTMLASSSAGTTAMLALATWPDTFGPILLGLAAYEPPSLAQFAAGDLGAIWMDPDETADADADGFTWDDGRNPLYEPGSCDATQCSISYAAARWAPEVSIADVWPEHFLAPSTDGILYLDLNDNGTLDRTEAGSLDIDANGSLDPDEDFLPLPYQLIVDDTETLLYTPQALDAAIAAGTLDPAAWPAHLASRDTAASFWAARDMMSRIAAVAASYTTPFSVTIILTEADHGQPLPTRPHVVLFNEGLRAAGVPVRVNGDRATASCLVPATALTDYHGGTALGAPVTADDVNDWAFPESLGDPFSRSIGALSVTWDHLGPFDWCPSD